MRTFTSINYVKNIFWFVNIYDIRFYNKIFIKQINEIRRNACVNKYSYIIET